MNVLILGATGLIGSHAMRALRAAGCTVTGAGRRPRAAADADANAPQHGWREIDFPAMTDEQDWLPYLADIDAVINCVGIIRESRAGDFDRIHRAAPVALFAACERLGVRRVIQLSALGSAVDAPTGYWRSKGAAEADLLQRRLHATILRPSLVYGDDGASSRLFRMLATLPMLAMPAAHSALVQPIHVDDLCAVLVALTMTMDADAPREMAVVGPRPLTMAGYLAALRSGLHAAPALVLALPMPIAKVTAHVAALHPASALTPASLAMLAKSADGSNTADARPVTALLGRPLRDPAAFTEPRQLPAAVLAWGGPLIRIAMAVLWLITALVSWFGWPHSESMQWLAQCGVPPALQEPVLLAASLADAAIGLALLFYHRRWLWPLQIALVTGYTIVMSLCLPAFWLHPFGPLSKNLPLLALMAIMWRITESKRGK